MPPIARLIFQHPYDLGLHRVGDSLGNGRSIGAKVFTQRRKRVQSKRMQYGVLCSDPAGDEKASVYGVKRGRRKIGSHEQLIQ